MKLAVPNDTSSPTLSIAIPTFNRCGILEFCLDRHLDAFSQLNVPYEVVISDNASNDDTVAMVRGKIQQGHPIRLSCRCSTDIYANYTNALRKCRGSLITYLADDDAIDVESLYHYVVRLQHDVECAGIYTDWVAFDDESANEIHRYYPESAVGRFGWTNRNAFVVHILRNRLMPEIGIWRRVAYLRAVTPTKLLYPFVIWAYGLLQSGDIEFAMTPFYRENRVLKSNLQRTTSANSEAALGMIGEPMRLGLENLVWTLLCDANVDSLGSAEANDVRNLIDGWLLSRVELEVARAAQRRDWIVAVELQRRLGLWHGLKLSTQAARGGSQTLASAAAMQRLHTIRLAIADVTKLRFLGEELRPYCELYNELYPDSDAEPIVSTGAIDPCTTLIAAPQRAIASLRSAFSECPGHIIDLDAILYDSRVTLTPLPTIDMPPETNA